MQKKVGKYNIIDLIYEYRVEKKPTLLIEFH